MNPRTPFQKLSNDISAAVDTGNRGELDFLDYAVSGALAEGAINLSQAGELTADIEIGIDELSRGDYLDEGFAAIAQGL